MSRHGYVDDDCDDPLLLGRWRAQVKSAIRGKRGQAFLKELAAAMDAMPKKELIVDELIDDEGGCCAIGVVCKARGLDVSKIDYTDPEEVGGLVGVAHQMAAEIEYENDTDQPKWTKDAAGKWIREDETPSQRWERMRRWVDKHIEPAT